MVARSMRVHPRLSGRQPHHRDQQGDHHGILRRGVIPRDEELNQVEVHDRVTEKVCSMCTPTMKKASASPVDLANDSFQLKST